MRTACFIPIKANSERIKGKNLRLLNGKPLYQYISEHVKEADVFDDVYIDTNSQEVADYAKGIGFKVIERKPELAQNTVLIFSYHKLRNSYTNQAIRDTIRNTTVINTIGSFSERRWSA